MGAHLRQVPSNSPLAVERLSNRTFWDRLVERDIEVIVTPAPKHRDRIQVGDRVCVRGRGHVEVTNSVQRPRRDLSAIYADMAGWASLDDLYEDLDQRASEDLTDSDMVRILYVRAIPAAC